MAWTCSIILSGYLQNAETGEIKPFKIKVKDPSPYRQAICRIMIKLGNILTAGRRRSWVGMPLYETSPRGQYFYAKLKDMLLYRRVLHGIVKNATDGKRYRF